MLRLARAFTLHVEFDGELRARSEHGAMAIAPDELALALAFGSGRRPEDAARDAGFAWDDPTCAAIDELVSRGVLAAVDASDGRFFDDHADAWTDDAYGGRYRRGARRVATVVREIESHGSAVARSVADGQRGEWIESHGSAVARSVADGQRGELIESHGSAGARSVAEGQRGDGISAIAGGRSLEILDVGCGAGALALELAAQGHRVVAIDRSERMIARARLEAGRVPGDVAERVRFRVQSIDDPLVPGSFDVVTALGVEPYVDDVARLFDKAGRALRPGGHFVVSAPNRLATLWTIPVTAIGAEDRALLDELARYVARRDRDGLAALVALRNVAPVTSSPAAAGPAPAHAIAEQTWRRRYTPDELAAIAGDAFDDISAVGFMPPVFAPIAVVAGPAVEAALVAAFDALAGHPLALAWSDELVAVLRRR